MITLINWAMLTQHVSMRQWYNAVTLELCAALDITLKTM